LLILSSLFNFIQFLKNGKSFILPSLKEYMLKENVPLMRVILSSVIMGFVGLVLDGVKGAILGYIATLLVFLIFWAFRKYRDQ
jgi:hypothetical protein